MSLESKRTLGILVLALLQPIASLGSDETQKPTKWEAGGGFGYLGFEHYPASNQRTDLFLPFPTFQYRGNILRADDREGAKLFLLKTPDWVIQLGGVAFPPLDSAQNEARRGMSDIPIVGALGPQLQSRLAADLSVKLGAYPAAAVKWLSMQAAGVIWEADVSFRTAADIRGRNSWGVEELATTFSFNLMGASKEIHDIYFGVPIEQATMDRPAFDAVAGIMQSQVSFFQSFKSGNLALYFGARISDYRLSINRSSPLHKTDQSVAGLFGLTYTFFRSSKPEVSYDDASGLVGKIRERSKND